MAERRDAYEVLQLHPSARPEVVEAAYRALAQVYHPDRNGDGETDAMAELNWAYSILRDPEQRTAYDRTRVPIPVEEPATGSGLLGRMLRSADAATGRDADSPANVVIDFGRYAGRTLGQLARIDREYLEWLRRHSSGARYRHQIDAVLRSVAVPIRASAAPEGGE